MRHSYTHDLKRGTAVQQFTCGCENMGWYSWSAMVHIWVGRGRNSDANLLALILTPNHLDPASNAFVLRRIPSTVRQARRFVPEQHAAI